MQNEMEHVLCFTNLNIFTFVMKVISLLPKMIRISREIEFKKGTSPLSINCLKTYWKLNESRLQRGLGPFLTFIYLVGLIFSCNKFFAKNYRDKKYQTKLL